MSKAYLTIVVSSFLFAFSAMGDEKKSLAYDYVSGMNLLVILECVEKENGILLEVKSVLKGEVSEDITAIMKSRNNIPDKYLIKGQLFLFGFRTDGAAYRRMKLPVIDGAVTIHRQPIPEADLDDKFSKGVYGKVLLKDLINDFKCQPVPVQ